MFLLKDFLLYAPKGEEKMSSAIEQLISNKFLKIQ